MVKYMLIRTSDIENFRKEHVHSILKNYSLPLVNKSGETCQVKYIMLLCLL